MTHTCCLSCQPLDCLHTFTYHSSACALLYGERWGVRNLSHEMLLQDSKAMCTQEICIRKQGHQCTCKSIPPESGPDNDKLLETIATYCNYSI